MIFRTRDEIAGMLGPWRLLEPGLVRPWEWPAVHMEPPRTPYFLAGVGIKD